MKRIKRVVTVTYEYDSVDEALRHRRIMEADGWLMRIYANDGPIVRIFRCCYRRKRRGMNGRLCGSYFELSLLLVDA